MNKQIEEMVRDLEDVCENRGCNYENGIRDCDKCRAEWLYKLGYRKASDVLEEVWELGDVYQMPDGIGLVIRLKNFVELKKKYESEGVE